jgi:hypothetical protein
MPDFQQIIKLRNGGKPKRQTRKAVKEYIFFPQGARLIGLKSDNLDFRFHLHIIK